MKLTEWLTDKEIRRQIITWTIIGAFFLVPLLVAVLTNDFIGKIESMLDAKIEITGLALAGIFTGGLVIYDFKQRAVEDVRDKDKDIDKSFTDLHDKKREIDNDSVPIAMNYIDTTNEQEQEHANFRLTQRKKQACINQLTKARINKQTRKIKRLEVKLERYKTNNLFDKKFRGLDYDDVLTLSNSRFKKERSYRGRHIDNPTSTNWWFRVIVTPLRFLALGGSLVSSFALGIEGQALLLFYLSITLLTGLTSLLVYVLVTNRVINKTHSANLNMIKFIDKMNTHISNVQGKPLPFAELDKDYSKGEVE